MSEAVNEYVPYLYSIVAVAHLVMGILIGTSSWAIYRSNWARPEYWPTWLIYLSFPYRYRKDRFPHLKARNYVVFTIRRHESLARAWPDTDMDVRARREYIMTMCVFWPLKVGWNLLLIICFLMADNAQEFMSRCR
jgi:hypothetical protein